MIFEFLSPFKGNVVCYPVFDFVFARDGSAVFAPAIGCRVEFMQKPAFRFAGS